MEPTVTCPKCQKLLPDAPNYCPACGDDLRGLTPTADTLSGPMTGKLIDGRYRLAEKLGEGGMGAVYRVEHVRMGKILALKLLRPDLAIDRQLKARFRQEARIIAQLSHPNTIQVFDSGELEDGSLFIAMEYLSGRDLAWTLRTHGPLPEEKVVSIGVQVLASLAEAHELGIVHRDIKPANVMLIRRRDREDLVKVLDFGVAKLTEAEGRKFITGAADVVGTPAYMSPEQARGEPLDPRSDLYSVAAMLFELVSGRAVFVGPTPMGIVSRLLTEPPPRLSEIAPERAVSPAFEQILRKALEKDRDERYADAEQMRAALERVRRDLGALAHDPTPLPEEPTQRVARRQDFSSFERRLRLRRVGAPLVALALLAGLGLGGFQLLRRTEKVATHLAEREPNEEPTQATRIALGQPVTGTIAAGRERRGPDRDLFLLEDPQGPLSISLSGLDDMNLALELSTLRPDGGREVLERILFLDDVGVGLPERVDALRVRGQALYLRVEERPHHTEAPREPREKSHLEYRLEVSPTDGPGQLELEPNDLLGDAPLLSAERAVTAFTGAPLRGPAGSPKDRPGAPYLSTHDLLLVPRGEGKHFALVVPPAEGGLFVADAARAEAEPVLVRGSPRLLSLEPIPRGAVGILARPAEGTPAGSRYHVAFVSEGPAGLAGALELAERLRAEGRSSAREELLSIAAKQLPDSLPKEQLRLSRE